MPTETIETAIAVIDENQTCVCSNCGREYEAEDGICFDDQDLCHDCAEELTVICVCCGERVWNEHNAGDSNTPLCGNCYDRNYTTCEECGAIIHLNDVYSTEGDDNNDYCYSCYCHRQNERRFIHDYSYKPDPIFYPSYDPTTIYLGVELELDEGGEDSDNAEELLGIVNSGEEHIYCKHDGSLESGLEFVSYPADLSYHKNSIAWKELCERAVQMGYKSHMCGTCGLHVHVSRDALGNTQKVQEETIARILYFVEAHFNEMLRFSRRTEAQLNKWARRYGLKESPGQVLDNAKNSNLGRYTAVNLMNYSTIEFRLFRGTLKYQSFIAVLQMVNEICKAAIVMSDDEFRSMSWGDFVLRIDQNENSELIEYLKIRMLYVNEEIIAGEEI